MATVADLKLMAQVQEQAKHMEEQEAMIKTLNKQLTHCETDLQAHMDLVNSLETSLADSEKNRKSICSLMQQTVFSFEIQSVKHGCRQLNSLVREMASIRRSIS